MSDKKLFDKSNFPAFNPNNFEIKTQIYEDTGGSYMVGSVEFYLPEADTSVWVNCNNETVSIYTLDIIWSEDNSYAWDKSDDYVLFYAILNDSISYAANPWLKMIKEALEFTIENETSLPYDQEDIIFPLRVDWLPDSIKERVYPEYID